MENKQLKIKKLSSGSKRELVMKPDINNRKHAETLARFLSGEMGKVELQEFEKKFAAQGENKTSIEEMKKQWKSLEGYSEPGVPDTRKAWDTLHSRLSEDHLIPAVGVKRKSVPNILRIAATIILLLGVSAIIYLNMNHKAPVDMVRINTVNEASTLIKTLNDGSVIYIAQNSLFSFPRKFETDSRNVALTGEAFFDIAPNPAKPFIIETDEAFVQVLGTAFNVKTENGSGFELSVDRGKVKVTLKNNLSESQLVVAGEKISTSGNNLVKSKYIKNASDPWYQQRMRFKDEPLKNIINVLNRNFNTKFVVKDEKTGDRKLTVTFHNETAETMTELICVTLNLKSQNINGSVVLSGNKENARQN
jgi:ferric-dicitrate binding protein FerR (iron transport regulator)